MLTQPLVLRGRYRLPDRIVWKNRFSPPTRSMWLWWTQGDQLTLARVEKARSAWA